METDHNPSPRPRILVLTRNLPPLVGGMERLVWHMVEGLSQWADVSVIGPPGSAALLPPGVQAEEVPIAPLPVFFLRLGRAARRRARQTRPNWVLAASGLAAPFALASARAVGARTAVYLHGLDAESNDLVYRLLWKPTFRKFDQVIANSHFTRALVEGIGVASERVTVVHPGVTPPDLSRREEARRAFRARYGLEDARIMLYVGRITARKGLRPFVEHALSEIVARVPNAHLVVLGDEPRFSARRQDGQLSAVHRCLARSGLSRHVHLLGERAVGDPELSEAYFAADVHVFPVQQRPGDNEGFGMVAVEAAAHGLWTVAFAAGGVTDAVRGGESGTHVLPGDWAALHTSIVSALTAPGAGTRTRVEPTVGHAFAWPRFHQGLRVALGC